jgi:hypothetical protein
MKLADITELPGYAGAIHPEGKCWAWSGRSSKLGIRQITQSLSNENGETNGEAGRGALAGSGKVVDTGKGKFGMDVKFVSFCGFAAQAQADIHLVTRWTVCSCLYGGWADCGRRHGNPGGGSYLRISRYGCPINLVVP